VAHREDSLFSAPSAMISSPICSGEANGAFWCVALLCLVGPRSSARGCGTRVEFSCCILWSVRQQLARGVEGRPWFGLALLSSILFFCSFFSAGAGGGGVLALVAAGWGCGAGGGCVGHESSPLRCVLALCVGSFFPRLPCNLSVPFVLVRIPIHYRRSWMRGPVRR
jgi:hypothetical protein